MSFTDDYNALKEKRKKKELERIAAASKTNFEKQYFTAAVDREPVEDIAPVKNVAPVKTTTKEEEKERTWFQKGAFEDGYQFGDVMRTLYGVDTDLADNLGAGILGIGEKAVDFGASIVGGAAGLLGNDKLKEKTKKFIAKDLYDEEELAKKINKSYSSVNPSAIVKKILGIDNTETEEISVLGEKSDSLVQSGGELAGTIALQSVGVPWYVTSGVTSYGGSMESALNEGATFEEASLYSAISAGSEILTEKLFGGSGLGEKGLINLEPLTKGISNKVIKVLADYGVDILAEGSEEVVSSVFSRLGSALYKEENIGEILASEEAFDEYLESFIGGGVLGGVANVGKAASSIQTGRDYRTELTENEQKVVDKVYEEIIAEREKDGEKLSDKEKSKIYDSVLSDMDKGYIDTDTIESVLGGEDYSNYQNELKRQQDIDNELKELRNMKSGDMTDIQVERMAELKAMKPNTEMVKSLKFNVDEKIRNALSTRDGKGSRLLESYNERARRGQQFEADISKYDEKQKAIIQKAIDSGILNNTNRTHEFVDFLAKMSADKGVLFDFLNNEKLKGTSFARDDAFVNGYYDKNSKTIGVNIDSAKAVNSTVGHEITHVLEGTELYTELQNTLFEYAKTKGEYDSRRETLAKLYAEEDIDSELAADLVGDYLFQDSDFINHLSVSNRNVFQKIYDEIKYLYKIATAGSKQARELERVKRAFDKAYNESAKGAEGTKYSVSDNEGKALTQEQSEYFKDSKMRDDNGNLMVMYHGSQDAGFHTFDAKFSDDDTSFFFVDRNDVAATYSGTSETYEAQTIRSAEDMNKFIESIGVEDYEVIEKDGKFTLLYEGERVADSNSAKGIYKEFCWYEGVGEGDANYKVYLNLKNPLVVDAEGRNWNAVSREFSQEIADRYNSLTAEEKAALTELTEWGEISIFRDAKNNPTDAVLESAFAKLGDANIYDQFTIAEDNFSEESIKRFAVKEMKTRDYAQRAKEQGYDGVIFKNIHDNGGYSSGDEGASTVAIAFESNQIKSVANDKPTADKDIRYSLSVDSEGRKLSDNQAKYFEGSKVVDDNGNLKVVYHGSPTDFNEFSLKYLGTNGTNEGYGFYFTDTKRIAEGYSKGEGNSNGRLFETYLDIKKPLSDTEVTISRAQFKKLLIELNNQVDADGEKLDILSNYGDVEWEGLNKVLNYAIELEYDGNDNDVDIISSLVNSSGNLETVYRVLREVTGYDGIIVKEAEWGGDQTIYIAFHPEQIKNIDNLNPTDNPDTRYSLSENNEQTKVYGNYNIFGDDIRYKGNEVAVEETVEETVDEAETPTENIAPPIPETVAPKKRKPSRATLSRFTKKQTYSGGANLQGAYNADGKQYLSDGVFVAEFNTIDEKIPHNKDYPIDKLKQILNNAVDGQSTEKYSIDLDKIIELNKANKGNKENKVIVGVGDALYDSKYIEAVMRAIPNPTFALSKFHGAKMLVAVGNNGTAVLMPLRAGENMSAAYEAQEIKAEVAPEGFAPTTEAEANAMSSEILDSLTDADAPPEVGAPYYGESEEVSAVDPFENRDIKEVGNRKVKAYMYENPEVKPFFQREAGVMLNELQNTTKGERWYVPEGLPGSYGAESYGHYEGTSRHTTDDIAYLLDTGKGKGGYSYAEIEKGLKAIIEDNGQENNACSKRIEFLLNDRLMYGYQDLDGYNIPADQDYINLLNEKQITEYTEEARKNFFESVGASDVSPVVEAPVAEKYEAIRPPRQSAEPRMKRIKEGEDVAPMPTYETTKNGGQKQRTIIPDGKTAKVLTEEPKVDKKKTGAWSMFKNNVLDKGMVFEDLSLETGNRELQARWNSIRYAEGKAQKLIGEGNASVSSLNSIREAVERTGKTQQFYDYLYHKHNVDRMSLESKAAPKAEELRGLFVNLKIEQIKAIAAKKITDKTTEKTADTIRSAREYLNAVETKNKPVFGDAITAEVSQEAADKLEKANPEFKELAQEVYDYMNYLRETMVDNGVISSDTAKLWAEIYPHYVPIRRAGKDGAAINVPLDTGRTGVNAPIKRATGGNSDILPLFDTIGQRTIQTYRAIAKNRFGVELKNTLGTTISNETASVDDTIDSVDTQDGLLQEGKNGNSPTFTVFENGERVTFEITEEMYDAMKPTSKGLSYTNKVANTVGNVFRGLLTEYNPVFMTTNAVKDAQDILINSQHAARTYAAIPKAIGQMATKGHWYKEYLDNGGEQNTYFDNYSNTFKEQDNGFKKIVGMPLRAISTANNIIEKVPRLAEYIASRESGRSVDVAMLDAARVTTNFAAGGDVTKFLNRNGFNFINASTQGAVQQVRNVREAKANGLKGWLQLATKVTLAGVPAMILNNLLWDDDEEYEELSDYVKDNYYIVAKFDDGKFVRIPKGRTLAVIQDAFEQMENLITGDDEVDLKNFLELAITNLAPNNPLDNNIIAPISQVLSNRTWYGEELVPTRLQDLPAAEQYDESTDSISKWLGEKLNVSPYKLNYLLNQYSGGIGDVVLPMLTPETDGGGVLAPFKDKFTTDSVLNNQNVSDFYTTVDELTKKANSAKATEKDILSHKYMNSINSELGELYAEKRAIQNSVLLSDSKKYEAVRRIQEQIVELTKTGLANYDNIRYEGGGEYAVIGDKYYQYYTPKNGESYWRKLDDEQTVKYKLTRDAGNAHYVTDGKVHYRLDEDGEWTKISDKQLERQNEVTKSLGITPDEYWSKTDISFMPLSNGEYEYAYDNPEKYAVSKAVGGYDAYRKYSTELYNIKADKDENGKSINGSRKDKVFDYINSLNIDYGAKLILWKSEYNADDNYNAEIVEYLNSRDDISYDDMKSILEELGFTVDSKGNITWD